MPIKALIFSILLTASFAEYAPLFLFGGLPKILPALYLVKPEEFLEMIATESPVVIFVEHTRNSEHFLHCNDTECFQNIRTIANRTYFRKVNDPIKTAEINFGPCKTLNLSDFRFPEKLQSCTIVHLNKSIKIHDEFIKTTLDKIPEIVGIYTPAPHLTPKTKAEFVNNTETHFLAMSSTKPGMVIYYSACNICSESFPSFCKEFHIKELNLGVFKDGKFNATLVSFRGSQLIFMITISKGYFIIDEIVFLERFYRTIKYNLKIEAPTKFSYYCGYLFFNCNHAFTNSTDYIVFEKLQIQVSIDNKSLNSNFRFAEPWNCVGFFTIPILSGLFIVFILIVFGSIAILRLLDISIHDRFDKIHLRNPDIKED